ncbi:hypothetical protein F4861DRAFT_543510 [Xylaria intraflava]|nr:hypothetical protein F4861DRAFT_543510 [Xylaria intraflava]
MRMKLPFWTTLLLAATVELFSEAHTSSDRPSYTHESAALTWTGHIENNGEPMSFTGSSLRHIEAQIREIKPGFSWSRAAEPADHGSLVRDESDVLCDMSWNPPFASVFHILQGIEYLRKIHGNCTNGPGPANCARVSCSYSSGIWFCNDNPQPISVPCRTFGDRAFDIVEKCYAFGNFPTDSVHGQAFDTDGWNVFVAGTDC